MALREQYTVKIIFYLSVKMLFYSFSYEPLVIGDYKYPLWANLFGWFLTLCSIMCVPIMAYFTAKGSFMEVA